MSLTPLQESTLTGGGDCLDHYHLADRIVTHQDWRQLVSQERVLTITGIGTTNIVSPDVDIIFCRAAGGTTYVQLPNPALGLRFTLIKIIAAGSMVVTTVRGTINSAASFTMTGVTNDYATFKAIENNYYRIG